MYKVDSEKIINDFSTLTERKQERLNAVEAEIRAYASQHGYDEEKTEKFVIFAQEELEDGGLSADERAKLEVLGEYIEYVEAVDEPIDDETIADTLTAMPNDQAVNM